MIIEADESAEEQQVEKKIFISYSWANKDIADMIDEDFSKLGFNLTRDERDLKYKDSIKQFMQQIGKHDYVIMLISDSYLKSENCMYEVMEVMRNREYKDKILMIMLKDQDKKYYKDWQERVSVDHEFKQLVIGADIYSSVGRIGYIQYWEQKEKELESYVARIQVDINKIQPLNELKRINNITRDIGDFLTELSDWKGLTIEELKRNKYEPILSEIQSIK